VDVEAAVAEKTKRRPHFGEPFFLQWNITDRCNLACEHCYREEPVDELDREQLLRVLDNFEAFLGEMGRKGRVMLSGGEPLLSPHFFDLAEACRAKSLPVRVLTNGTLIDTDTARKLAETGVQAVQVSIEGPRRVHERVRGTGSYDPAIEGMRALREAGLEVTLAYTLTAENRDNLATVARIAAGYADRFHVARHVPIGRGAALGARPLTGGELHTSFMWLTRQRRAWSSGRGPEIPMRDPLWKSLLATDAGCDECVAGCSIGYNGVCVDADATVYPCRRLPITLGNALETPLAELWRHPALERLRDRDTLEGRCGRCEIRWTCGGCRAVAHALLGYPMAEDPQCFRATVAG
jgi:radical SAM protein with 4Fe4S-binding SPASM domain